jgi:hypothetical protein
MHISRDEERPNARRLRLCLSPRHVVELLDWLPDSGDSKKIHPKTVVDDLHRLSIDAER